MMKGRLNKLSMSILMLLSSLALAKPGSLFNVVQSGAKTSTDVTLCLNGKGPVSCQNFHITKQDLQITTVAKHYYPNAGIKIITPNYGISGCSFNAKTGYCLFAMSNTVAATLQVNSNLPKQNQSITFTSTPPTNPTIGGSYTVTATGGASGNPVVFSIDGASSVGACSISGNLVSFANTGTCIIDANQAGNSDYNAALQVQQIITVNKADQTITFTSTPSPNATIGGTYTVTATGGASGNPVVFSIDANSTSGACTISGSLVSFTGDGTCIVDGNQAGNANYNAADQEEQIMVVNKIDQTITFTSTPPSPSAVGGTYTVTATGGTSGNPVVFSIDGASSVGACSISGNLVSFANTGTCIIDANQTGNSDYNAALQVQQIITVNKADQTITFTSTPPPNATIGGTYTVTATGGTSGNPVVFSIDANSTSGACTISGSLVSFTGNGTCIVDANQAGNANYNAADQEEQIMVVNKIDQTITFTSTPPSSSTVGGTYTVTATGGASGNPVVFSIDGASSVGACSISGNLVSFANTGTCIIDASQAGNSDYNAALQVQQIITVNKADQTITFTSTPPSNSTIGGTYTVTATGGASGNPVVFSIDANSTSGACTISGSLVSFTGDGTCIVDANQAGNANYNAADQEEQIMVVNKIDQTITFTSTPPPNATIGGTYTVTATGGASGNPVVFSIDGASSVGACSISGNLVSFANTGTCIIDANQTGNSDYNAALQVQQIITVNKADQTITFTSTPPSNATIGGTYTVTATGGASGNPVVFSIDAGSTSGACNITGNLVSFTGAGSCIVDANQAGNSNYNAATQAQQIITVNKIDQTITFTSTPTDPAVGGTYTVSATGGASGNPVVFSIDASSSSGACSINGTLVSFTGVGTCIIDANQAGNAQYNAAAQEQQILNNHRLKSVG